MEVGINRIYYIIQITRSFIINFTPSQLQEARGSIKVTRGSFCTDGYYYLLISQLEHIDLLFDLYSQVPPFSSPRLRLGSSTPIIYSNIELRISVRLCESSSYPMHP